MRTTIILFGAALLSVAATGCTVRARTYGYAESPPVYEETVYDDNPVVFHEPPPLVPVEPDVYVVHDYHAPVYWVGGAYWRFHAGVWYRAADWNTGWVSVNVHAVPRTIAHRDHRHYVRYRPSGAVVHRVPARSSYGHTYRTPVPSYRTPYRAPSYRTTPAPHVRHPAPARQVVRPGYVPNRAVPARRPGYNQPVERQRVRGRDDTPPQRAVPPRPRPQPRVQPYRNDRRVPPRAPGSGSHEPHTHPDSHPHQHR